MTNILKKNGEFVWLAWTSQPVESEKLVFAIAKSEKQNIWYPSNLS